MGRVVLTVLTCTARPNPRFDVLADTLYHNLCVTPAAIEWIIVDARLWYDENRREELSSAVKGRFAYQHVEPKPSLWQGPHRLTKSDCFDLNSARNTGICLAKYDHIVLLDDCLAADEDWLKYHLQAANKSILVGTFESVLDCKLLNGKIVSYNNLKYAAEQDHRVQVLGDIPFPAKCSGGWTYGLNFSFPLSTALELNGFDEMYSGAGGCDDVDFGVRAERFGTPIYFHVGCKVYQLMESHKAVCGVAGGASKALGEVEKKHKEWLLKDGKMHFANERLIEKLFEQPLRYKSLYSPNMRYLRSLVQAGKPFPVPTGPKKDWRDGQPLQDME